MTFREAIVMVKTMPGFVVALDHGDFVVTRRESARNVWFDPECCDEGPGPRHTPSKFCESGKRPHCTCDMCF